MKPCHLCLLIICVALLCFISLADEKKMQPEELIARHLESLGNVQARAAAQHRVVAGMVNLVNRVGSTGSIKGQAMFASAGPRFRFGMNFPSQDYTGEDLTFDGKKAATGFLPQGKRSNLSLFLNAQDAILKEGLIGGVLSTAWPLLRIDQTQPHLDYRGLKKIDDRQLHELSYRPNKGKAEVQVKIWFEQESFRHLRTEYSYEIGARLGNGPNESGRQQESRYKLIETFDDFRVVDGLTLPHKYRLQLSVQTMNGSLLSDWSLEAARISHKEQFDDQIFTIR